MANSRQEDNTAESFVNAFFEAYSVEPTTTPAQETPKVAAPINTVPLIPPQPQYRSLPVPVPVQSREPDYLFHLSCMQRTEQHPRTVSEKPVSDKYATYDKAWKFLHSKKNLTPDQEKCIVKTSKTTGTLVINNISYPVVTTAWLRRPCNKYPKTSNPPQQNCILNSAASTPHGFFGQQPLPQRLPTPQTLPYSQRFSFNR